MRFRAVARSTSPAGRGVVMQPQFPLGPAVLVEQGPGLAPPEPSPGTNGGWDVAKALGASWVRYWLREQGLLEGPLFPGRPGAFASSPGGSFGPAMTGMGFFAPERPGLLGERF